MKLAKTNAQYFFSDRLAVFALGCVISLMLTGCGGGGGGGEPKVPNNAGPIVPKACDTVFKQNDIFDVYIINLNQENSSNNSCAEFSDKEDIAQCVEDRIRAKFASSPECLTAFDVFVPGTNQETGDFKQFTSIVSDQPGRTYLSLQYRDHANVGGAKLDAAAYGGGVKDASESLDVLLYTLRTRFNAPDVRVFGHSKGSEAVADVSLYDDHNDVQFYAFAQPGATQGRIRGEPGYIHKRTPNLVTITWLNDEVQYFKGFPFPPPEIWGWPGYVNQEDGGGTLTMRSRIDHHNNYGGEYVKEGEDYPYCATGHKEALKGWGDAYNKGECEKRFGVEYQPYFWGDAECTAKAFELMATGEDNDKYYIGYSGPRAAGCKDNAELVLADYTLRYRLNPADDDDCKAKLTISLKGLDDRNINRADGGSVTVSSVKKTGWITDTGKIWVPLHMELELKAYLEDVSGRFTSCHRFAEKSEMYVDYFMVEFTHPATEDVIKRSLIGLDEGQGYLTTMVDRPNVAWKRRSGNWDLQYGIPVIGQTGAVMAKGEVDDGSGGTFFKRVHLVD